MSEFEFDDGDVEAWDQAAVITHELRDLLVARGVGPSQGLLVGVQLAALCKAIMVDNGFPRALADFMLESALKMTCRVVEDLGHRKGGN